ncbi:helix-turn-helix domain-containing protein [Candidatus Falkowbacteria bacterium]|nr:MAG: helix-turn-helix domain-containing protein [Candidatus Falkowbacteria bacterium]
MATLFSISRKTVYRLVDRRLVPFHKIGGVLRFRKKDIEEYLNSTRIDPVS